MGGIDNVPRWRVLLQEEFNKNPNIAAIAAKVGVSRPALSQIINGCGPYGTGLASTKKVEQKVLATFDKFICPHLTEVRGEDVPINGELCRDYAIRDAPTGAPNAIRHWQACQVCTLKPAPAVAKVIVHRKKKEVGHV